MKKNDIEDAKVLSEEAISPLRNLFLKTVNELESLVAKPSTDYQNHFADLTGLLNVLLMHEVNILPYQIQKDPNDK